jgi:hypothetical protein
LELPRKKSYLLKMGVTTQDEYDESSAKIFVETEGANATFLVRTLKINGEGERVEGVIRHLRVERNFRDGTGEVEPFAEGQDVYTQALKDVIRLWDRKFGEVDKLSLCRSCPAHKDGLPRPVV